LEERLATSGGPTIRLHRFGLEQFKSTVAENANVAASASERIVVYSLALAATLFLKPR